WSPLAAAVVVEVQIRDVEDAFQVGQHLDVARLVHAVKLDRELIDAFEHCVRSLPERVPLGSLDVDFHPKMTHAIPGFRAQDFRRLEKTARSVCRSFSGDARSMERRPAPLADRLLQIETVVFVNPYPERSGYVTAPSVVPGDAVRVTGFHTFQQI